MTLHGISAKNLVVRKEVASFFAEIDSERFDRWKTQLWNSSGVDPQCRLPFHDQIAKLYDIQLGPHEDEGSRLLYAIQSFYAAVVQKVVRQALGFVLSVPFLGDAETNISINFQRSAETLDLFGGVYQSLYPASARKALGEFYTPDWLAQHLIDRINCPDQPLLDPACGSGIFLLNAIRKMQTNHLDAPTILQRVRGFDLNPLAVLMARANIALMLKLDSEKDIPVFHRDSLLEEPTDDERERFHIIGNPPWLNWDRLPESYRNRTSPLWKHYGLFSLSGSEAQYGGAKKELAQLMLFRVADLYLKPGARLAMLLPGTLFRTGRAGEGFRRFTLPNGKSLGVLQVDDYSGLPKNPFSGVMTRPVAIFLEKGGTTNYPVPFFCWQTPDGGIEQWASPIDATKLGTPWIVRADPNAVEIPKQSEYRAYLGANTGGANGVFWFELIGPSSISDKLVRVRNLPDCGKLAVQSVTTDLEKELLYPLLCWKDIDRDQIRNPTRFLLLAQDIQRRSGIDPKTMQRDYPRAFKYLRQFETLLRGRAAYRKYQATAPFYSMYNIGPQTIASIKVVWRRMDNRIRAAIAVSQDIPLLGVKPLIPQETCVLIPCQSVEEARFLVDTLNSKALEEKVLSFCPAGSKGFGSPGMLDYLGIPHYSSISYKLGIPAD